MSKKSARAPSPRGKRTETPPFILDNVAMVDCACTRAGIIADQEMPNVVVIKLSYRTARWQEDSARLLCTMPIETTAAYAEGQAPALALRATFAALLRFSAPLPESIGNEKARNFIRDRTIFQVWPYWRQFVQSTTVRMGLPPMQLFPEIPQEMLSNFVTTE
ncbi:MAG: hypothetical protein K2Y37_26815 [Pirellulales bacterium]|nr:hypothetical protein [Pirellulales bacterium]